MKHCTVSMFSDEPIVKNRRMTPQEKETDLWLAKLFKRPPCDYILDRPTYPYVPSNPFNQKLCVNFDLNYP